MSTPRSCVALVDSDRASFESLRDPLDEAGIGLLLLEDDPTWIERLLVPSETQDGNRTVAARILGVSRRTLFDDNLAEHGRG
jgi:hypothetical protein